MTVAEAATSDRLPAPRGDGDAARTMTVAYYSPGWPPGLVPNGVVSYVGNLRQGLLAQGGVRPWVVTPSITGEAGGHRDVFVLPRPGTKGLLARCTDAVRRRMNPDPLGIRGRIRRLAGAIDHLRRNENLDLFEIEDAFGIAHSLAPRARVPIVVRLHGPCFLTGSGWRSGGGEAAMRRRNDDERLGLLAASAVTAPSAHVLQATREHFGLELPNARVIHNPILPVAPEHKWSLDHCEANHILYVGRFESVKGGDVVIDAFARIAARHPTCRLTFVGPDKGCVDGDGKRWLLREYVSAKLPRSAQERFEWLDFQPHDRIAVLRQRAMVTLVPSRYETFGLAAVEALAAGCPVVASNAGGLGEVVRDGHNAVVARSEDPDDFAEKVLSLLERPSHAAALGARAAADTSRFHADVIAAQSLALYRDTIERFRHARGKTS